MPHEPEDSTRRQTTSHQLPSAPASHPGNRLHRLAESTGATRPDPRLPSPDARRTPPSPLIPCRKMHLHQPDAPLLFKQYLKPPQERIPHLGHLALLCLLALFGLICTLMLAPGRRRTSISSASPALAQAATDIHYTLGTPGAPLHLHLCRLPHRLPHRLAQEPLRGSMARRAQRSNAADTSSAPPSSASSWP